MGLRMAEETYFEEEKVRRREIALKVMLATPHKPHQATKPAKQK